MSERLDVQAKVALVTLSLCLSLVASAQAPTEPRELSLATRPWAGDFDAMVNRRMIRVLVPYSRTLYYNDKGRERGLTAELVRDFERYINQKYAKQLGTRPITVYMIPTTRDRLLPQLVAGYADIAAGNLTAIRGAIEER